MKPPVKPGQRDDLYATRAMPGDFVFDERVAAVFDDMIHRSVPGYATIIAMTAALAERYCPPGTRIYDLGCSLGAASLAIADRLQGRDCEIIAVDSSRPMLDGLESRRAELGARAGAIQCRQKDSRDWVIGNASLVILNFALQFIAPEDRSGLMQRIHAGMTGRGAMILSEKIVLPDPELNSLYIDVHHEFKRAMGYSELEISRKRAALEKVLLPETVADHRARLADAGLESVEQWFQCLNWVSMLARKRDER